MHKSIEAEIHVRKTNRPSEKLRPLFLRGLIKNYKFLNVSNLTDKKQPVYSFAFQLHPDAQIIFMTFKTRHICHPKRFPEKFSSHIRHINT